VFLAFTPSFICVEYSFIFPLASVIMVVTCSRVIPRIADFVVFAASVLLMAMSALAMAVLTSEKPNSLSRSSKGGLVPSKLLGWGMYLIYMYSILGD
jgi:hypothetical protein